MLDIFFSPADGFLIAEYLVGQSDGHDRDLSGHYFLHLHQSILDINTGENIFTASDGSHTDAFLHFIGGSQKHLMSVVALLAPYVNSYRRYTAGMSAPTNLEWAADNRTTGLRIPTSTPEARRVENRVIGIDCNPYLAIAASLACGYLGMVNKIEPRPAVQGEAYLGGAVLPDNLADALTLFEEDPLISEILSKEFCALFIAIKTAELEEFKREISPWERKHLMLNV